MSASPFRAIIRRNDQSINNFSDDNKSEDDDGSQESDQEMEGDDDGFERDDQPAFTEYSEIAGKGPMGEINPDQSALQDFLTTGQ